MVRRVLGGYQLNGASPMAQLKSLLAVQEMQEAWVQSLGQEDPLEEDMATHSSVLAWRIPWTEEPAGLQPGGHSESDTTERPSGAHTHQFHVWRRTGDVVPAHRELEPKA